MLYLRVRRAAVDLGVPLVEHRAARDRPHAGRGRGAAPRARARPARSPRSSRARSPATAPRRATVRSSARSRALDGRDGDLVVVLGRQSLAESADAVVAAAAALAELPDVKFLSALRRGNVHGALDLGLAPGFLPGRVTLDAGRDGSPTRGAVPRARARRRRHPRRGRGRRRSTRSCCSAPTSSPTSPTAPCVAPALDDGPVRDRGRRVPHRRRRGADVFLPTTVWGEKNGTATNIEGRVQRAGAPGLARGHGDGRLAHRRRARAAVRHRLRPRDRRGGAGRDRPRRARLRRRRRRAAPPRAATASCCPIADHPDEIVLPPVAGVSPACRGSRSRPAPAVVEPTPTASADDTDDRRRSSRGADAAGRRARPLRVGPGGVGPGAGRRPTRTLSASWPPARSTTPAHRVVEPVARPARARRRARRAPERPRPHRGRADGDEVRVTSARAAPSSCRCAPTPRSHPAPCFMPFAQGGAVGPNDLDRRRPPGHRAPRGDDAVSARDRRRSPTRCFANGVDLTVVLIVIGKTIVVFVLAPALGADLHLVPAQGHRRHAEPDRPRPGRARSGCSRPSPTASSCSSRSSRSPTPPTGAIFLLAPYLSLLPAFLAFAIVPIGGVVTIAGHQTYLQLADLPVGVLWLLAMSGLGLYGVMLAGWSSGSKYPLLGSVRASAQLLSYEAAFGLAIVGVLVQAGTLSTRGIVDQQGWDGIESIVNGDWYWLPAIVALVDLPHRRHRRDQPPAVRPRRGRAGAHRRVLHRVHRHPLRDLLPRRVHEPHHDVGDRGDAVLRRAVGPGARLPRRQRLVQRVGHAGVLVHAQGDRAAVLHGVAARVAAAPALRPAHGPRLEVPHRDRVPLGDGLGRRRSSPRTRAGRCGSSCPPRSSARSLVGGTLYASVPKQARSSSRRSR